MKNACGTVIKDWDGVGGLGVGWGGGGGRQQIFINVDAEKPHSAAIICNYIMKLHDAHLLAKLKWQSPHLLRNGDRIDLSQEFQDFPNIWKGIQQGVREINFRPVCQLSLFSLLWGKSNTGTSFHITQVGLGRLWHTWKFDTKCHIHDIVWYCYIILLLLYHIHDIYCFLEPINSDSYCCNNYHN